MTDRTRSPWLTRVLALGITGGLLVLTARLVGVQALLDGWAVLTPWTVLAALGCGLVVTLAQALRWKVLAGGQGIVLSFRRAVADCYASSLGNMVLPGGLGGDAARVAVYRNHGERRWWSPLLALGAERLTSTALLFTAAAVILAPVWAVFSALAAAAALVFLTAAAFCMRGLSAARQVLVWLAAAVGVSALLALYLVAMAALHGPVDVSVAVIGLAAMSVPLGVGGWGVRELSVSVLAPVLPVTAEWAVTASIGYGLLATISTLPGAGVLLAAGLRRRAALRRRRQAERDAARSGSAPPR